jgi:AraC-like DNA-binding protein
LLVVTCVADAQVCARLRDSVRDRGEVRVVRTLDDISRLLRSTHERIDIVVVPPRDVTLREAAGFVRETAKHFPDVALVAYCNTGSEHGADIRTLAVAGVHHFFFAGEQSRIVLRAVLVSARRECAGECVTAALTSVLNEILLPIVETCLARPSETRTVGDLVNALGLHRKTLYNHCRQGGLSGPAELIAWSRLALVAYLLAKSGRTVESIADELEFASVTSLRNMMKRYTGCTAGEVRSAGGLPCVIAALQKRLATTAQLHLV